MMREFTSVYFCYWLDKMGISHEEAAGLLKVSLPTIKGYAYDHVDIPEKVAAECWLLLRLKTEPRD